MIPKSLDSSEVEWMGFGMGMNASTVSLNVWRMGVSSLLAALFVGLRETYLFICNNYTISHSELVLVSILLGRSSHRIFM
jgi:hypothetical protein